MWFKPKSRTNLGSRKNGGWTNKELDKLRVQQNVGRIQRTKVKIFFAFEEKFQLQQISRRRFRWTREGDFDSGQGT